MRLAGHHGALCRPLNVSLRRFPKQRCATLLHDRHAHQLVPQVELREAPNPRAQKIAVLGGGLTGLATAYQLARTIPQAKITLYEKENRLGGWLDSEVVPVDDGEVLFEWGPRSIRPDPSGPGFATLVLLVQLGIYNNVIGTGKNAPAATNRYVYFPDHLVRMPGPYPSGSLVTNIVRNVYSAFTEPIFNGVLSGLIAEPTVRARSPQVADESLGSFLRRRFGPALTDNLASAVIHGIYAGDIYDLSARTLMPSLWYAETRDSDGNGVITEFADLAFKKQYLRNYSDVNFQNLVVAAKDLKPDFLAEQFLHYMGQAVSAYTFAEGTGFLARNLSHALEQHSNVTLRTSTSIDSLEYDSNTDQIRLAYSGASDESGYDYVVSTLPPAHLKGQLNSIRNRGQHGSDTSVLAQQLDRASESVHVMVVNLYYSDPNLVSEKGFGYLIPQSISTDQNPERALGVIFGSETSGVRGPSASKGIDILSENLQRMDAVLGDLLKKFEAQNAAGTTSPRQEEFFKRLKLESQRAHEAVAQSPPTKFRPGQDTASGTKLTVMLGGHWWKNWTDNDLPSEEEAIEMAKSVLARHLKITDAPLAAKARLNKNCIPQYRPGYRQSMAAIHNEVLQDFQGRLKLAGSWWQGGVGVNDCIRKARLTAFSIREAWDDKTGLEDYGKKEQYVIADARTSQVVMDPLQS